MKRAVDSDNGTSERFSSVSHTRRPPLGSNTGTVDGLDPRPAHLRVLDSCPSCRGADGSPAPGLEPLPGHLGVLSRLYAAPGFLGSGPQAGILLTPADEPIIVQHPSLRALFAPE